MRIIPCNDRILIEKIELESKSSGGIVLAQATEHNYKRAKVLALGPGKRLPTGALSGIECCKVGDTISYAELPNQRDEECEGKKLLLITEAAVLAVIEE